MQRAGGYEDVVARANFNGLAQPFTYKEPTVASEDVKSGLAVEMRGGVDLLPGGTDPIAMCIPWAPVSPWEMPATRVRGPEDTSTSPSSALITLNSAMLKPLSPIQQLAYPSA
jgi:hypothetical protein